MSGEASVTLFLAGDVMTGRGVDQILPHPGDPRLHEPYVSSALEYVRMAEIRHGEIPAPVPFAYPWGDALAELERRAPHARIINLETAVTDRGDPADKAVLYRMSPTNLPVLSAAGIDVCTLANNHLLDWGREGLLDSLDHLDRAGIRQAGGGRNVGQARAPAVLPLPGGRRLLVFSRGSPTAGVPGDWAAVPDESGIAFLSRLSDREADRLVQEIAVVRRPGDVVVVSLHWGPNWGYEVRRAERRFAHRLVESGHVHVIHGHSSHHPRPMEVHRERAILYGCGDFLNDYEGISGHREFRPDLVLMYLVTVEADGDGGESSVELTLVPFRLRKLRLQRADPEEAGWLAETLNREGRSLGTRLELGDAESGPVLRWVG